jgi:hypothetical protein
LGVSVRSIVAPSSGLGDVLTDEQQRVALVLDHLVSRLVVVGEQAAGALLEISTLRPIPGSLTLRDSALFSAILARGAAGTVLGVH